MIGDEGTAFAVTSALFLVIAFGVLITFEGIVGRDIDLFIDVWGKRSNRWVLTAIAHGTHQPGIVCSGSESASF